MKKLTLVFYILLFCRAINSQCYRESIISPTPFMGNHGEIFKLGDGTVWKVEYEYEYLYEYYPGVIICPSKNIVIVNGEKLNVKQLHGSTSPSSAHNLIESQIDGDFNGWEGNTIYKLINGQIWQQVDYHYCYHYSFAPKIIIFTENGRHFMQVDGISHAVEVKNLK
jgi:hypothetical protein